MGIPNSFLFSLVPVTGSRWRAQYEVVEFQPRAEDTRTLDSGLKVIALYLFPIDDCGPPSLSPTPRFPRPSSMDSVILPAKQHDGDRKSVVLLRLS